MVVAPVTKYTPGSVLEWVKGYYGPTCTSSAADDTPSSSLATVPAKCAAELLNAILGTQQFPLQAVEFCERVPQTSSNSGSTGQYYVVEQVRVKNCKYILDLATQNGFTSALTAESWAQCSDVVNIFVLWRWILEQESQHPIPSDWKPQPLQKALLPSSTNIGSKRPRNTSNDDDDEDAGDAAKDHGAHSSSEALHAGEANARALAIIPASFQQTNSLPDPVMAMVKAVNLQRCVRLLQIRNRMLEAVRAGDAASILRCQASRIHLENNNNNADNASSSPPSNQVSVGSLEASLRQFLTSMKEEGKY